METKENIITEKYIDLEKVIGDKNPKLLKFIPGFVLGYFKRIIHVDKLNGAIWNNRDKFGLDFVKEILLSMGYSSIEGKGTDALKSDRKQLIISNHPLGGLDGMALMHVVGKTRKDIAFPVNDILLNLPNLKELFLPINKHGSNGADNVRLMNEAFASDKTILYFPAGMCSRKIKGQIQDLEWKKTFVKKARDYQRDIVPAFIDNKNSNFFYNFANIRKLLGIKANLEMLYLVDEMYMQKDKNIRIRFGNPIPYESLTKERTDKEWTEYIRAITYDLKNKHD